MLQSGCWAVCMFAWPRLVWWVFDEHGVVAFELGSQWDGGCAKLEFFYFDIVSIVNDKP